MDRSATARPPRLDRTLQRARWATANLTGGPHGPRPEAARPRHVLHLMHNYGLPSETFVRDALVELEVRGWTAWVGTIVVVDRDRHGHPPDDRLLTPEPPDLRGRVALKVAPRELRHRQEAARTFLRYARTANPAILHAHFGWAGVDAMYAARVLRRPLLVSFHGTDLTVFPQLPEWSALYRELVRRLDCATVVSRFTEGKLRGLGYEGDVHVVPAGVRLERIPARADALPREPITLLYVGRQVRVKGLDVLLRALPAVVSRLGDVHLVVIGDGEERRQNESIARELGLERRVEFRGALPHDAALEQMARSHMVIVPSRTMPDGQAEGSPVVTKEAQAMGVPLVATRCGGVPETVAPELRHELVAEGDAGALAERIVRVACEDDESGRRRAAIAQRWVREQFDWTVLAGRIEALYERLVPSADGGPAREGRP